MPPFTREILFNSDLSICQPKEGYRFSVDPIILANHVFPASGETILDLGCGCGIMPLILARRHPDVKILGIEIQEELALLAKKNVHDNGFEKRVSIFHQDIRTLETWMLQKKITTVISNPPYKKKDSGRLNPHPQKAAARHEVHLTLNECLACAFRVLEDKGEFVIIYPAERLCELMTAMKTLGFSPRWARFIHTRKERDAKRVIL